MSLWDFLANHMDFRRRLSLSAIWYVANEMPYFFGNVEQKSKSMLIANVWNIFLANMCRWVINGMKETFRRGFLAVSWSNVRCVRLSRLTLDVYVFLVAFHVRTRHLQLTCRTVDKHSAVCISRVQIYFLTEYGVWDWSESTDKNQNDFSFHICSTRQVMLRVLDFYVHSFSFIISEIELILWEMIVPMYDDNPPEQSKKMEQSTHFTRTKTRHTQTHSPRDA